MAAENLAGIFSSGVLSARIAELRGLQPLGMLAAVLRRRVIPVLTIVALQCDDFSHDIYRGSRRSSLRLPCANPAEPSPQLFDDLGDRAGSYRVSAFANREAQTLLQSHRRNQRDLARDIVARHHHLHSGRQLHIPRHVRGPEIKLGTIPGKEW